MDDNPQGVPSELALCVDIGGTFTDIVLVNSQGIVIDTEKVLTTPGRLDDGALLGIRAIMARASVPPGAINKVVHATTQTSNTIIERSGAKTALITTIGFRDVLEIARESRYDVYDLFIKLPAPLVSRSLRFEVGGRVLANGEVENPLSKEEVSEIAKELINHEIESVAVSLLHAYRIPQHEKDVRTHLKKAGFKGAIILSSEVCPEIREYERTATTVANAYLYPKLKSYLGAFEKRLRVEGVQAPLQLFSSYGGRMNRVAAERRPVEMLECGAAAGVLVASAVANQLDWDLAMSFDMGGTTAKMALIEHGKPQLTRSYEVARLARFVPGSGLPVAASAVDLIEIGAGGGSIAAINEMGLIDVGPESAASEPGPACYDRGGSQPTVTDADLVLGYLGVDSFGSGALPLNLDAARDIIDQCIAKPLGRTVEDAAKAIHEIVVEQMSLAARLHIVGLGYDPRKLKVIAFGGAGPLHACAVAERLGSPEVVVMPSAAVGAAIGLALAPTVCVVARSRLCLLRDINWKEIGALISEMKSEALTDIDSAANAEKIEYELTCDMRYRGQGYEINVPFEMPPYETDSVERLASAFGAVYRERYGRENLDGIVEIVSWRLEVRDGKSLLPRSWEMNPSSSLDPKELKKSRAVFFDDSYTEIPVWQRHCIEPGFIFSGPALIAEANTTTVIKPDADYFIDDSGNLRILMKKEN
jgi:N-methylhydantoinase A